MDFLEVAKVDEVSTGKMKSFVVDGKEILVANYAGVYFAIGGRCTHAAGDLSQGKLEGKIVTCPVHGARFDVTTGICVSGPEIGSLKLKAGNEPTYGVRIEGKSIQVRL
jgi:nitrite reductase (NADH) small subunit/3-phenylpropionate/trans-cinnamate dioxygenase ferredoxin subunit